MLKNCSGEPVVWELQPLKENVGSVSRFGYETNVYFVGKCEVQKLDMKSGIKNLLGELWFSSEDL